MRELSVFVDESGDKTAHARYFILTLVFHDQSASIAEAVGFYERSLAMADLPNIPFHSEPLLNGHGSYANLSIMQRKKMLASFSVLVRHLPIRYRSFVYERSRFSSIEGLAARIEEDMRGALMAGLAYFQSFGRVKVYYDNGQALVKQAIRAAMMSALSSQAVVQKRTTMTEYRLAQVADYLCTIELAAAKYAAKENGGTYDKFFGTIGSFKKNWLKQARCKAFDR